MSCLMAIGNCWSNDEVFEKALQSQSKIPGIWKYGKAFDLLTKPQILMLTCQVLQFKVLSVNVFTFWSKSKSYV